MAPIHKMTRQIKIPTYGIEDFLYTRSRIGTTTEPANGEIEAIKVERQKCQKDELICYGHILNALFDRLYDLYINMFLK